MKIFQIKFLFNFNFGRFLTNNRAFGNRAFFYNIFAASGGDFHIPPDPVFDHLPWFDECFVVRVYEKGVRPCAFAEVVELSCTAVPGFEIKRTCPKLSTA